MQIYLVLNTMAWVLHCACNESTICPLLAAHLQTCKACLQVLTIHLCYSVKIAQAGLKGGETISSLYGAEFNVKLGRQDTSTADPPARIPGSDASVADIQA